jgi:hypothetical protein
MRTLSVQLRAPNEAPDRPFAIAWRHGSIRAKANDQNNVVEQIPLCVPAAGTRTSASRRR